MRKLSVLALTGSLVGASVLTIGIPSAQAAAPSIPRNAHVTAATSTSFTVTLNRSARATAYRVFTASSVAALYTRNITAHTKHATAHSPRVRIGGFRYSGAVIYYRVEALKNTTSHKWDPTIRSAGLRPPTPSRVGASASAHGSWIHWAGQSTGSGFVVAQATNSAMTAGRVDRRVGPGNYLFSPYGLKKGTRYYFRVRAMNSSVGSGWSSQVSLTPSVAATSLHTLTYNVLESTADGKREGTGTIAPWSARRTLAAKLITETSPDVVAVQEAAAWIGRVQGRGGVRQIDDLAKLLPGYKLVRTEVPPSEPGYFRTGVYILYRTSTLRPIGGGNHWNVGNTRWAAYQQFQSVSTGARFLFVSTHLQIGSGRAADNVRASETTNLIHDATSAAGGLPIVYAGDFNSNTSKYHAYDAPSQVMRSRSIVDTHQVAAARYNERYNSANQYYRKAPETSDSIDYIFTGPGIGVSSWGVVLHLSRGSFVGTMASDHNPVFAYLSIPV